TRIVGPRRRKYWGRARAGSTADTPARNILSASEARVIAAFESKAGPDREGGRSSGEPTGKDRAEPPELPLGPLSCGEDGGETGRSTPGAHDPKSVEPSDREKTIRTRHRSDDRPPIGRGDTNSCPSSHELGVRPSGEPAPEALRKVRNEPFVPSGREPVGVDLNEFRPVPGQDATVGLRAHVDVEVDVMDGREQPGFGDRRSEYGRLGPVGGERERVTDRGQKSLRPSSRGDHRTAGVDRTTPGRELPMIAVAGEPMDRRAEPKLDPRLPGGLRVELAHRARSHDGVIGAPDRTQNVVESSPGDLLGQGGEVEDGRRNGPLPKTLHGVAEDRDGVRVLRPASEPVHRVR